MLCRMSFGQMIATAAAIFFVALLVALLVKLFGGRGPLPYFSQEFLVTRGEHVFYSALRRAVPDHLIICPKVRMCDLIGCSGEGWKAGYGAKISQKHIDFTLADADTTAIALAIELDDRSHRRPDRIERDEFVDRAFATAGIPMLRVPAAPAYDVRTLRKQIAELVEDTTLAGSPT
jgi:hypothetical protein